MSDYSSRGREWEKKRKAVLNNSGGVCANLCGRVATQVDHIIPKVAGGTDDLTNLQALCNTCNASKGSRVNRSKRQSWKNDWWFEGAQ